MELQVEPLEVFDLAMDPLERRNLAATQDGRALAMAADRLSCALSKLSRRPPDGNAKLSEQLRALGYVE